MGLGWPLIAPGAPVGADDAADVGFAVGVEAAFDEPGLGERRLA